ncbi:MAG TPA: hypothetical protein VN519_06465 [Bryobacteraceae bacterium]|nr:hypothetical protein [Bryobacteraceae bacterium]
MEPTRYQTVKYAVFDHGGAAICRVPVEIDGVAVESVRTERAAQAEIVFVDTRAKGSPELRDFLRKLRQEGDEFAERQAD